LGKIPQHVVLLFSFSTSLRQDVERDFVVTETFQCHFFPFLLCRFFQSSLLYKIKKETLKTVRKLREKEKDITTGISDTKYPIVSVIIMSLLVATNGARHFRNFRVSPFWCWGHPKFQGVSFLVLGSSEISGCLPFPALPLPPSYRRPHSMFLFFLLNFTSPSLFLPPLFFSAYSRAK
jgi:hypothetical protein